MAIHLRDSAFTALKEIPPPKRGDKIKLGPTERLALLWLADKANKRSGLTWLSQTTLARLVGCSKNSVGPAVHKLRDAGQISMLAERRGRSLLYLVHPDGRDAMEPFEAEAIASHLKAGRFGAAAIADVIEQMAELGLVKGHSAGAAIVERATKALHTGALTDPNIGTVCRGAAGSNYQQATQTLGATDPNIGTPPTQSLGTNLRNKPQNEPLRLPRFLLKRTAIGDAGRGVAGGEATSLNAPHPRWVPRPGELEAIKRETADALSVQPASLQMAGRYAPPLPRQGTP